MYLKSLEIHGFKSFANKIEFQFHNGITGIVGPNGSGKSNVADAVRWVLGEQSAKQLRGSNMQDVIFSGTENRKMMGYAYVAITLDNSDHQLAIDYEEVTVARRVYRSGESEYLINGTSCRLKDVNELFYDTGIGKEGYSIIGQGQIDRILSGKPEERRELFDEAAGIVKFKRRKAAAVKKLTDEQNNLTRVNDILGEIEKQVGPLAKQSEKAKIYLSRREQLKKLDINAYLLRSDRMSAQMSDAENKYSIARSEFEEVSSAYENTKSEYEKYQSALSGIDAYLESKRNEITESELNSQKLSGEIDVLKEQINSAKASDEHYNQRISAIKESLTAKEKELSETVKKRELLEKKVTEVLEKKDDTKESLEAVSESIKHLMASIGKSQQGIEDSINEKNELNNRLAQQEATLEQIEIRRAEMNSRLLRARSEEEELLQSKNRYQKALEDISKELSVIENKISDNEEKVKDFSEKLEDKDKSLQVAQQKYHELNTRLESLRNLSERYEGYGNSIRRIMEKKNDKVCGVVADLIKTEEKYETAIETALGGNIQNIVTEDDVTAKEMIAYIREKKLGRATFLPLTTVTERDFNAPEALKGKGVIGLADTLVKCEDKFTIVANNLLHNYIVVDNIDNALALARKFKFTLRCVTLNGEALNPGGSISGGSFRNNSNLLGRTREMEELKEKADKEKKRISEIREGIDKLREKRKNIRLLIEDLKKEQQDKFIGLNTAKVNLDRADEQYNNTKNGYDELHKDESEILHQVALIESEKKEIEARLSGFDENNAKTKESIDGQNKLLSERREKEEKLRGMLGELEIEFAQENQALEFEKANENRISGEKNSLMEELSQTENSRGESQKNIDDKYSRIAQMEEEITAARKLSSEGKTDIEEKNNQKEELSKAQVDLVRKREELLNKRNSLDKEVYRLSAQINKLKDSSQEQYNYMISEYDITPTEAKQLRDEELNDLAAMEREIMSIKAAIRELGPVNVNAIEDYINLTERYEFLNTQRNDLVEAKEKLEQLISELDEGMRTQFTEKFSLIAKQFDKVFKEMFGGGKGTLELLEDEDILEAGIRIIAQPPGKKLQNMMQLSGGEKALTAIALLFAIQNLKPSPFCLLDEIEAALDEGNVSRFAGYLNKLTKHTQFIVITHRRGTMEKSDRLFGITMQEKGVSALVSVNLIDEKDLN